MFLVAVAAGLFAAGSAMEPVTVCEVFKDPAAYAGKPIIIMGRYSFRRTGRYIGEESCGTSAPAGEKARPVTLALTDDPKAAPQVPPVLQIDGKAVEEKLERIRRTTSLGRFRFGSSDYDRWAAVYGQLEKQPEPPRPAASPKAEEPGTPAGRFLIRGDGAVIFLGE